MTLIQYPRQRAREFKMLGLIVAMFVGGFFYAPALADLLTDSRETYERVSIGLFVANIIGIANFGFWRAHRFRGRNTEEVRDVRAKFPRISAQERELIEARKIPCTVHAIETFKNRAPDPPIIGKEFYAEFPDDESKMLFILSRPPRSAS